jgi:asparagine synthase (glutamine-hydrolysing)
MPGIVGLISHQRPERCEALVDEMLASMQHEKFYVSGKYSAPELGLFAGWVAMEGSFADAQPVVNERTDVVLMFSGEFFPDADTCARLKPQHDRVRGVDARWLVHLYEERGDSFFESLNGLFSGLLIDRRQGKAFLFNDRYGIERLYLHERHDEIFFASEAKALLRILPQLRAFDEDALADFLNYGCTLEWRSLFKGIQCLPGASLCTYDGKRWDKRRYFSPEAWEAQTPLTAEVFVDELEDRFSRILPHYFVPDRKIGVSLTGGLDTRMILACRPRTAEGVVSYTFCGADRDTLDARLAARVAAAAQIPHHAIRIGDEFFSNFPSLVDRTVYITDGCFGATGAHEIYLNAQARRFAPIRLTGNCGSEVLRSMTTFKPLGLSAALFDDELFRQVTQRQQRAIGSGMHPVGFAAFTEIPWHLVGSFRAALSQVAFRTPFMDNAIVALAFRAPKYARASSTSVLRIIGKNDPSLGRIETDGGLVATSRLSSSANYLWYRLSFKLDYWYGEGMPHWVSAVDSRLALLGIRPWSPGLHKFLHYRNWFRTELAEFVQERLMDVAKHGSHFWNRAFLRRLLRDHREGRKNYVREIDAVLTLDAIDRLLLRQSHSCHHN